MQDSSKGSGLHGLILNYRETETTMEFEHAFQQSGFLVAFQLLVVASLLAPGVMGWSALYQRFIRSVASSVVSFGPVALLVYVLYKVSHLS